MIFSLDVRRARKGDCLILHYGTKKDPGLIVIDGGPAQVYLPHLKPRLEAIRKARGLVGKQLPVDLLMISHIDEDHILGILELTGELVDAKNAKKPLPVKIQNLWHNSFDKIIGNDPENLLSAVTASFGPAALAGDLGVEGIDEDAAKVLASVPQGLRLADNAKVLKLKLNGEFKGKLVRATDDSEALDIGKGLSFTVIGPMEEELAELQKEFDAALKKVKKTEAALAALTDDSAANLSSIVVLAKVGAKSMLLTGDARADKIRTGLKLVGLLKPGKKLKVNLLKMPHHGSDRNMDQKFLEDVTADLYVFSGNGEHGNPERETLDMLRLARGSAKYKIHLTYPIDEIDVEREADWKKEQQKEKNKKKKNPKQKVRPNWSPEKNSLEAFFDQHPDMRKRLVIADETRHVIDLLDPVAI